MDRINKVAAVTTAHPETKDVLDTAERAFLLAMRRWVATRQRDGNAAWEPRMRHSRSIGS